jgi:integrase
LPVTFRPFIGVERTKVPPKALTEADLLTEIEVEALLEAARFDVDQFRRWGIEEHIEKHGRANMWPCKDTFAQMLHVYHRTGARTSELAVARVRDFSDRSRQIILREHKRSKTQQVATVRHIDLNDSALETVRRLCANRDSDEFIFLRRSCKPWNKKTLNKRLHSVRRIAVALGTPVGEGVTMYDFRHLWISDMLMAGVDVMTVARMAGTSVRMIETVYGHFRTDQFAEAHRRLEEARRARLVQVRRAQEVSPDQGDRMSVALAVSASGPAASAETASEGRGGSPAA